LAGGNGGHSGEQHAEAAAMDWEYCKNHRACFGIIEGARMAEFVTRWAAKSKARGLAYRPYRRSAAAYSLVKPSTLHCSEPTPLWTKNSPSGSYFLLIAARRG
jgi:hypothetical protein